MKYKVFDYASLHAVTEEFCEFLRKQYVSEDSIFDCKLVFSELAGNVLRHSDESADITAGIVDGKILLEVYGEKNFCPPEKTCLPQETYAEHGRGLYIVDKISESRAAMPDGGIRVVIRTVYKK